MMNLSLTPVYMLVTHFAYPHLHLSRYDISCHGGAWQTVVVIIPLSYEYERDSLAFVGTFLAFQNNDDDYDYERRERQGLSKEISFLASFLRSNAHSRSLLSIDILTDRVAALQSPCDRSLLYLFYCEDIFEL